MQPSRVRHTVRRVLLATVSGCMGCGVARADGLDGAAAVLGGWPSAALSAGLAAGLLWATMRARRRERKFAVSAKQLQSFFDNAPVAIAVLDLRPVVAWMAERRKEGLVDLAAHLAANPETAGALFVSMQVVEVNRAALAMAGLGGAAEAKADLARLEPDFREAFRAELLALWEGRHELTLDVNFRRTDGKVVHTIKQWTVPQESGRPDYSRVMAVFTDVSDLRRTETRLKESEDRWHLAVQGINAGIWEIDFGTGRFFVSERSREMLGYSRGDLAETREAWEALIHVEDRPRVERAMEDHLAGKTDNYRVEHRLLCRDGLYRWILARGLAQFDAQGRPVRFVGTHSDVHARKAAEHELASERERLRVTLRAMAEAVITTDRHGVVNYLNAAAEHLTGWEDGAAIGRKLSEVCPLQHERTSEALPPPHERALTDALVVDLPNSTALVHRQGVRRLVEGRCAPIRDVASQPAGVVLVLRDMTERAKLEADILRATKLESVGVLAGGIAHDFNNLLTVVMGNVTLAMLDTQNSGINSRWLSEAEKGLLRARDLTQQLLTFAKGGDPIRSAVNLAEVVRETTRFSLHGSKVKGEFEIEPDLWAADVDKGQIGQVVQNLVINAVQAMPDGGCIWVNLSNDAAPPLRTGLTGPSVRLSVVDQGAGIRPEHISKVFDPYFTTKQEGSGLGLATVYAVVRKHGGYIELESELGRGTRFRIWLPATRESVSSKALTAAPFGAARMNGRVLLMDDEEGIREMASQLLRRIGFEVVTAADGAEAVAAYRAAMERAQPFDLVIMDLTVPGGLGGLAAMRELLVIDPRVRAIVSSGYSSDPVMSDHRAYGFAGMIPKPYRITDFAKVIRQVLEQAG
ncbi:MAG: PAS domain S-box protein [Opitutaceae bacterium]|nr:PAS domain S-box protein [Opitutaceae bacterium]